MGEVYDQFVRDLEQWRIKYKNNPRPEIVHMLLLALEREAIVSTAYREQVVAHRLRDMALPDEIQELIRHALIWAWQDEEMHAIFIRGVIFKMGSRSLRLRAFGKHLSGIMGGWAGSVRNHVRWSTAPFSHLLATLITWAGVITGQVPEDVRKYLNYETFHNYCLFNVDAERTAWFSYQRLQEILPGQPNSTPELIEDFRRIQDDEERHTRIFEIMAGAIDEQDRLAPGETAESLTQKFAAIGEVFVPRAYRPTLTAANPIGSGGKVWVMRGATADEKIPAFRHLLDESGLSDLLSQRAQAVEKPIQELRIAIKPNFMMGYHHKDLSPITDPVLVEELASYLQEHGCRDLVVVETANILDKFYQNRSVHDVAHYFRLDSPRYGIVDLSQEQVPYNFYRGLAQYSVGKTWKEADFRISFAKLCSHPIDMVDLSVGNVVGLGARRDEFIFSERQSHRDTAVMMLLGDFPLHFALLDGYDLAPDGLLGMMGAPHPKTPRRLYAGVDPLSVDIVAARHLGMNNPYAATMIRSACYWFGDPSARIQVVGVDEPISGWRGPYYNEWSSLLSLMAYPMYQFGSGRGALFVPEIDEEAFPPLRRESLPLRFGRKVIQRFLGLHHPNGRK